MDLLSLGVLARSQKENERRLAIHPLHLERVDASLRRRLYLERGYGERFGMPDEQLAGYVAGVRSRGELLADCDVILLPKPLAGDLAGMHEGQVLWGWPHCVQNEDITQLGVDRRLTLIAFEAMHHWSGDGSFHLHVFHENNELAGYCSVLHATQLMGITGEYGRPLRAAVISFGAAGRGAVTGLKALGVNDIHVLTHRDVTAVASPIHPARIVHFERDPGDPARCQVLLVTLPEETPVNELVDTAYAVEDRAGVALGPIVVNQCVPPLALDGDVSADAALAGVALGPSERDALIAAAQFRDDLVRRQDDQCRRQENEAPSQAENPSQGAKTPPLQLRRRRMWRNW